MSRESSLPLPFEVEEPPSSPPLLPHNHSKKRARSNSDIHDTVASSDPMVFSSDDAPEGVENYATPDRRKRQYTGTWNVDSGVWLNSDSSDDSALEMLIAASNADPLSDITPKPKRHRDIDETTPRRPVRGYTTMPTEHVVANAKIHQCLEDGNEKVDLSGLQLRELSDNLVQPLQHLIKHPKIGEEAPSEDAYEPFIPSLQVYLSNNLLRTLPGELWHLQNLTVLSLRNNKLTELSPAIANLKNLRELNLAGNKLRWLPWELLQLVTPRGRLSRLNVTPNPFVRAITLTGLLEIPEDGKELQATVNTLRATLVDPEDITDKEHTAWSLKLHETLLQNRQRHGVSEAPQDTFDEHGRRVLRPWMSWKQYPVFFASTPVTRMDFDGSMEKGTPPRPSHTSPEITYFPWPSVDHSPSVDIPTPASRVPSLFELSLRAASHFAQPSGLRELLPTDSPEPVLRALDAAAQVARDGGQRCSVCQKQYVLPRAEWIEYWHYVPDSLVCSAEECYLPFLRRACSFGCAATVRGGELVPEEYK